MLILNGCSATTGEVSVADGSGFSTVTLKRESSAYLINNDLEAYRDIRANNETCAAQPGCAK